MFQKDKFSELLDAPVSRPEPFSLVALIAWLETQRSDGTYDYENPGKCLICQYLADRGFEEPRVTPSSFRDGLHAARSPLPENWDSIARRTPWTTQGALLRARAYAASQVQS